MPMSLKAHRSALAGRAPRSGAAAMAAGGPAPGLDDAPLAGIACAKGPCRL